MSKRVKFQIIPRDGSKDPIEVDAFEVEIGEAGKFAVHRPAGAQDVGYKPHWIVSEWRTSYIAGRGSTRKAAIEDARIKIIKVCGSLKKFPVYVREKFPKKIDHGCASEN